VTGFGKGKLESICIDRRDGKVLWRQTAPAVRIERVNGLNSPATPTPVADGERVYVYFGSYGLIAYDHEGREQWRKPLPILNVRHGTGTSPILAGGRLVVNGDQEDMKSFLIAVDPRNGETIWRIPRPACFSSHTTPVYWRRQGAEEVIVAGSIRLVAYDLKDGSERWSCRGLEAISICPTPVIGDGIAFAMSYSMEQKLETFDELLGKLDKNGDGKVSWNESPRIIRDVFSIIDLNRDGLLAREEWDANFAIFKQAENGLFAVGAPERGDVTGTHVLWKEKRGMPEASSPLYYRGRVFIVKDGGLASCFDAKTGRALYVTKRVGAEGQYFASPVAADGKVYIASRTGVVSVIEAGDSLNVLARNDLGEAITATPAIVDNKLYVRTAENLYAFGE
jgi:outer membrane protein assembly factor BamB